MGSSTPTAAEKPRGSWARTVFAIVFIILGALLAPAAVVSIEARAQLTRSDTFVETFAPLANNPEVRRFVTDQTVSALENSIDIPRMTAQALDGITPSATGPVASLARTRVQAMLIAGIRGLVHDTVSQFVNSDRFARAWSSTVRASHEQIMATLQGDPDAVAVVGREGSISIQLGPIIERTSQLLASRGLPFAKHIPAIDRSIPLVESSSAHNLVIGYGLAVLLGTWLPWLSLGAFGLGILLARRRVRALTCATLALVLSQVLLLACFGVARVFFLAALAPGILPMGVVSAVWSALTGGMSQTAGVLVVFALAAAIVAWYASSFPGAHRVRTALRGATDRLRSVGDQAGVSTGRVGEKLYSLRVLVRVLIAAVVVLLAVVLRPLTVGGSVWIVIGALAALVLVQLVGRPHPVSETRTDTESLSSAR